MKRARYVLVCLWHKECAGERETAPMSTQWDGLTSRKHGAGLSVGLVVDRPKKRRKPSG